MAEVIIHLYITLVSLSGGCHPGWSAPPSPPGDATVLQSNISFYRKL